MDHFSSVVDIDHIKGVTTARFTTLYGCSVLVPEYTGIVITGQ
ncbi:hypothetical protein ACLHU5_25370 [Escherichia coli]